MNWIELWAKMQIIFMIISVALVITTIIAWIISEYKNK